MAKTKTTKTTVKTKTRVTVDEPRALKQHDYILLDRSGSMAGPRWTDTLGGVNAYVQALARDPATKDILVTMAVFDSMGPFDILRKDVPAYLWSDVMSHEATPRAGTPLYDGIGRLVTLAEQDNPDRSAIVITTDGHENASREHTQQSVKAILDRCRARGWQVIFLGADFDNMDQGAGLGNAYRSTMRMASTQSAFVGAETATMRGSYALTGQSMNYSDEVRARASSGMTPIDPKA